MTASDSAQRFKAAAIQMVSGLDIDQNLQSAERLCLEAVRQGAQVVVLPENFALMESPALRKLGVSEATSEGRVRQYLARQAKLLGIWLVAGSLPCAARPDGQVLDNRVRSSCFVISPEGVEVARYDKIHLFDVDVGDAQGSYRESDRFEAGDSVMTAELPWGRVGLSICFDLRFPTLYQALGQLGASILTVPSAFTWKTGEAHWEVLLRARAIENQCFVLASNQGGQHSARRQTWGHSMIIDPWGRILAEVTSSGEGVAVAELDFADMQAIRLRMPLHSPLG